MIQYSCSDSHNTTHELLIPTLQQLEKTVTDQTVALEASAATITQDLLCGLLQVILIQIGVRIDQHMQKQIIELLIMIFKQNNRVTENGLIAYQGLCVGTGSSINIKDFGRYIKAALEETDEDSSKIACGIVSDLASSLGQEFSQYLVDFVPCLHNIL